MCSTHHRATARIRLALAALAMALAFALPGPAQAKEGGPFGLGVMLGDPTGVSFKYFLSPRNAVTGGLGYGWRGRWFHTHAEYLFHFPQRWGPGDWLPYVGIGGKLAVWDHHRHDHPGWYGDDDDIGLGIRIPGGVAWHPPRAPIDVFAEFAPAVWLFPGTGFDFDFSIGARFYF